MAYCIEYNKKRGDDKVRKWNREYRRRNKERCKIWESKKDPLKVKVRQIVRTLVYEGKLKKYPCVVCGNPKSQAHHEDYSKPLDIIWLCAQHHTDLHKHKFNILNTMNEENAKKTPITNNVRIEAHMMALRIRGIDHAIKACEKLELENIKLKEDIQSLYRELGKQEPHQ